jgi:hypothetical protein
VHHLPTRIKTLRFSLLYNFIASSDRGNAWYFQAWHIRAYAQVSRAEDVLKLKLDPTRFQAMPSSLCQRPWSLAQHEVHR